MIYTVMENDALEQSFHLSQCRCSNISVRKPPAYVQGGTICVMWYGGCEVCYFAPPQRDLDSLYGIVPECFLLYS